MTSSNERNSMDARTYAWNYFSVHAAQRMSVFQFFISLATATVGGAVLIAGNAADRKWSALLFLLLPFLSFIFWRLDRRTSGLIKNAEEALIEIEAEAANNLEVTDSKLSLFTNDKIATSGEETGAIRGHFSYSRSFRYVFVATGVVGILGGLVTLLDSTSGERQSSPASVQKVLIDCRGEADCSLVSINIKNATGGVDSVSSIGKEVMQEEKKQKGGAHGK